MEQKLNILYTCDNAYLPLTSISMASVIRNNPNSDICFYIATETEDDDNFRKLVSFYEDNDKVKIKYLNCKKYDGLLEEKNLDRWGSNSYYVYWKLFAYDNLDVDDIWYLDSDIICLSEITKPVLDKKAIGGVLDSAHAAFNKIAGIDKNYYFFNTGSLFVNIEKWKECNCTIKLVNYLKTIKKQPILCDQDILALALQNDFKVINPKYNYLIGYDYYGVHNTFEMYSLNKKPFYKESEIELVKDNVIFYHCLGGVFGRPWEDNNESPIKDEFDKYRKLSAWPDYRTKRRISLLYRIEKANEFLPKWIYNKLHNVAQIFYLYSKNKKG